MTPDRAHRVPDRGPGHPSEDVRRGVVRGHVIVTVGVLRSPLAEPWTLSQLAEEAHLSRSACAGDGRHGRSPPMAYLRPMRVQQMVRLLACSDLSIGAVARWVGWTDANDASNCLHARYGVSPTDSRRRRLYHRHPRSDVSGCG